MSGMIEELLNSRRSLEEAVADLLAEYQRYRNPKLVGTIEMIRAEIQLRKTAQARPSR